MNVNLYVEPYFYNPVTVQMHPTSEVVDNDFDTNIDENLNHEFQL